MPHTPVLAAVPGYSVALTGKTAKILRTDPDDKLSTTLTSVPPDRAADLVRHLNALGSLRDTIVRAGADQARQVAPGSVCYVRRQVLAAFDNGPLPNQQWSLALDRLLQTLNGLSEPVRRAVRDEVGRLLDGTEDVLVLAELADEFGGVQFERVINDWLHDDASDDDLTALLSGEFGHTHVDDSSALYEGVLAHLRTVDADIDAEADLNWIDVDVDRVALRAWTVKHRPHVIEQLHADVDDLNAAD